jgi:hypothetical protein
MRPGEFEPVADMVGGGVFGLPAGAGLVGARAAGLRHPRSRGWLIRDEGSPKDTGNRLRSRFARSRAMGFPPRA